MGTLPNMITANVIRTLSAFKAEGIIDSENKALKILAPEELIRISG